MYYICKDELNVSKNYSWHLLEWDTFKSKRQLCVRSRADPKFFGGTKQPLWPFSKISRALPYLQVNSHESYQMYSHIYCVPALPDRWTEIALCPSSSAAKVSISSSLVCNYLRIRQWKPNFKVLWAIVGDWGLPWGILHLI